VTKLNAACWAMSITFWSLTILTPWCALPAWIWTLAAASGVDS
jgi:hypothetical protein